MLNVAGSAQQGPNPAKQHAGYISAAPDWQLCRDLHTGERAMKKGERRKLYLIPLSGHKDSIPGGLDAYESYVERAYFFGAFGRTVEALTGLVNRIDPNIEAPSKLKPFLEDVDGQGTTAEEFCGQIVEELVKVGRVGVLTDWPQDDGAVRVIAEEEQEFRRPFVTMYYAENILNWREKRVGAKKKLCMVALQEEEEEDGVDEFDTKCIQQIRVLDLSGGYYRMRKFRLKQSTNGDNMARWEQEGQETFPTIAQPGGEKKAMAEIQFDILNHWGAGVTVKKSPMLDLANAAVAHFRNSADYENALHLLGFPQAYMSSFDASEESQLDPTSPPGAKPQQRVYHVGDGTLWQFKGPVKVEAVQLVTELEGLEKGMAQKREDMVALGARMLARDKQVAEAAKTEEMRRQPENSALGKVAQAASKGITRVFQRSADWLKLTGALKVEINTNFFDHEMSPQDLLAFIQAVQEGAFALTDLRWLMRRGNLIRAKRTDDEIDAELEQMGMPMSAAGKVDPNAPPPPVPGQQPPPAPVAEQPPVTPDPLA